MYLKVKIGFIYYSPCDFTATIENPDNVATAAVCFTAIQLAKSGHSVTVFSTSPNQDLHKVRCRKIEIKDRSLSLDPALAEKDYDALIFKNTTAEFVVGIKQFLSSDAKIFLWTNFAAEDPANSGLKSYETIKQINSVVCVSDWQRISFYEAFDIPRTQLATVPYAIAPQYENLYPNGKEFLRIKSTTPHIAYLTDVNDGLDIILDSFNDITDNFNNVVLGIFAPIQDPALKHKLENSKNIRLYPPQTLPQRIEALRDYTIFVKPSTRPTTYAVDIIETMAAGLYTISSDVAANHDYCFDLGTRIKAADLRANSLDNFVSAILSVCQAQVHRSGDFYNVCFKQVLEMNKKSPLRLIVATYHALHHAITPALCPLKQIPALLTVSALQLRVLAANVLHYQVIC